MKALAEEFEPFDPGDGRDRPFAPPDAEGLHERESFLPEADERGAHGKAEHLPPVERLPVVSADHFAHLPTPSRQFLVPGADLLPVRNVSALYGDGGTGKSLLALQLAVAVASGTSWLGYMPEPGGCLYLSAEDDKDETHIRLKSIVDGSEAEFDMLQDLHLAILAGEDSVLAHEDAKGVRIKQTQLFHRLHATLDILKPKLLILDNLADIFAGNENSKVLARQFIGLLRGLALRHDCTVLLLAHPSLSGLSSGSGTSGNTAWSNSVRSRLYLVRERDHDGFESDPNRRVLQTMKANYGPVGGRICLRWEAGRFIRLDQAAGSETDAAARSSQVQRVFLQLLGWHNERNKPVSASKSPTYAPSVFAKHPHSESIKNREFEVEMNVLLDRGEIAIIEEGSPSRLRRRLVLGSDPRVPT
jgi:RecA-family ATPase